MSATKGTGYVECDGCGVRFAIGDTWPPPGLLMSTAPDSGWHVTIGDNGSRTDLCPQCKHKPK